MGKAPTNPGQFLAHLKKKQSKLDAARKPNPSRAGKTQAPVREPDKPSPSRSGATKAPQKPTPKASKGPTFKGPPSMGETYKVDKPSTQTRVSIDADGKGRAGGSRSVSKAPGRDIVKSTRDVANSKPNTPAKPGAPKVSPKAPSGIGSRLTGILGGPAAAAGFFFGDTFSSKTGNQANYGEQEWIDNRNAARKMRKAGAGTYTEPYDRKPVKRREGGGGVEPKSPKTAEGRKDYGARVKYAEPIGPQRPAPVPKAKPADIDRKAKADKFAKGQQGQAGVNVVTGGKAGSVFKANPNANQGKKPDKATKYPGFKGNWKGAAPMESQRPKTFADAVRRADGGDSFTQRKRGNKLRSWK